MMRRLASLAVLSIAMVGLASACSSDDDSGPSNPPPGNAADLPGSYELVSLTQVGTTVGPPVATGTLTLTETTYAISITHPDPADPFGPPLTTNDNGTYSTDGNTWSQESSTSGLQGVGTYSLEGTTLTVDVTTAGLDVLTVWNKTD